ncbi:UDP-N-acetylmuramoyl-L-alanine--D-glutamate ligase [Rariglobus hedericola]|uniref:UDP-N-acetylmuramoylalanine--D-glutamate ligase n=1 Tax=Rariglobus hedericola TaxID=2597822 RepID=A0A556QEJ0_9BACT|nr:UDP-N-acetylmuramoyl-L-alanine--D-glutamate ligase [Rariglobus hedericola]TSJ75062.1 UDP-N-acetylmuramoyl-L-alanine--D-glutamate ligase [Rariglobus hedericola]
MSLIIPEFIDPLLAHPVAIFGGGVSGRALAALVAKVGGTGVIFDQKGLDGALTEFRGAAASAHQLVIYSPGFPPTHPWISEARAAGAVCLSELDFASLFWRGSVVAITGTNGKTTLTEFLTHALRSVDRDAYATGNIGFSFSQLVTERDGGAPDSIAVCEVSSFQSETLRYFRADAALWTNFAEDHLERHGTMEEYFQSKWRLFERSVGGHVFAGSSVQRYAEKFGQTLPAEAHVSTEEQGGDVLLRGTVFAHYPQRENFLIAAAWWRSHGLRETALYAAAQSFSLGEHRLARVTVRDGVTWWNDSKATNFHAVEAAVAGFAAPVILIAGGKSKGGDVASFVRRLAPQVKHAFFIGETRSVLATFAGASGLRHTVCGDLNEAVRRAAALAVAGDNILLSPGFASFDQFKNYEDRGRQFVALVNSVGATVV